MVDGYLKLYDGAELKKISSPIRSNNDIAYLAQLCRLHTSKY